MTQGRSPSMRAIFAESIDGISLSGWCELIEIILCRWDELANMDSTDDMIRRISWDARASRLPPLQPRHIRLAFQAIYATRRHDGPPGRSTT